jgi:hypothetical protein
MLQVYLHRELQEGGSYQCRAAHICANGYANGYDKDTDVDMDIGVKSVYIGALGSRE